MIKSCGSHRLMDYVYLASSAGQPTTRSVNSFRQDIHWAKGMFQKTSGPTEWQQQVNLMAATGLQAQ